MKSFVGAGGQNYRLANASPGVIVGMKIGVFRGQGVSEATSEGGGAEVNCRIKSCTKPSPPEENFARDQPAPSGIQPRHLTVRVSKGGGTPGLFI